MDWSIKEERVERSRINWIVASYWLVALIGVPYWWATTTTERLSLPQSQVAEWQARRECPVYFNANVEIPPKFDISKFAHVAKRDHCRLVDRYSDKPDVVVGLLPTVLYEHNPVYLSVQNPSQAGKALLDLYGLAKAERQARAARAFKYSLKYKIVLSLMYQNSSTESDLVDTSFQEPVARFIIPLLRDLRPLHEFDIEVQTQHISPLTVEPVRTENGSRLDADSLKAFVNAADWNLPSAASLDPTIHLITFVPTPELRPMGVFDENGHQSPTDSFLLPQWGAVAIANPQASAQDALTTAVGVLALHLTALLGLSKQADPSQADLWRWQLARLIEQRTLETARDAIDTLAASIKLTNEISNMRVNADVRQGIRDTLACLAELDATPEPIVRLRHAAQAARNANKAFFHPSMLGLLYFPNEHKYAIYTPLFGPIGITLVAYTLREISRVRKERKSNSAKSKAE